MKSLQLLTLGLAGALAACSGGGGQTVTGAQCPADYKPIIMEVPDSNPNKIAMKEVLHNLPPGTYTESNASIYYVDQPGTPGNFRILITDDKDAKTGQMNAHINCVRNASLTVAGLNVSAQILSRISVGYKFDAADMDARQFAFHIEPNGKVATTFAPIAQKPGSPEEVYDKVLQSFVLKLSDTDFEFRAWSETADKRGQYWISATLHRDSTP